MKFVYNGFFKGLKKIYVKLRELDDLLCKNKSRLEKKDLSGIDVIYNVICDLVLKLKSIGRSGK